MRSEAKESQVAVRAAAKCADQHLVNASGWRPTLPMLPLVRPGWNDRRR
jgi:hypothetical protein